MGKKELLGKKSREKSSKAKKAKAVKGKKVGRAQPAPEERVQ